MSGCDELHPRMGEERLVTEVPSSLKQLARLVVRGFYTIEDALIVDMLVRNPCEYICGIPVLPKGCTQDIYSLPQTHLACR